MDTSFGHHSRRGGTGKNGCYRWQASVSAVCGAILGQIGWGTWIPSQCKIAFARHRNRIRFQGLVHEWTSPLVPGSGRDVKDRFAEAVSTAFRLLDRANYEVGKSFPSSSCRVPEMRIDRMYADTMSEGY